MSGQEAQGDGERPDWWAQLYDPHAADTGRTRARDTLDERYRSASRTLTDTPAPVPEPAPVPAPGPAPAEAPTTPPSSPSPPPSRPLAEAPAGVLPAAEPASLGEVVPDTVVEGTRYGCAVLRAASVRGERARQAGELRTDALLVVRFGAGQDGLLLCVVAAGARSGPDGHRAAREACHSIGAAVGRSSARLAEDIRRDRRSALQPGLHRLTDRTFGRLRAQAAALGLEPEQYTVDLRCLLLPADPRCRTRVFFGSGAGGLLRLRDGGWQDVELSATTSPAPVGDAVIGRDPAAGAAAVRDGFTPAEPSEPARTEPFRFRCHVAQPEDVLLLCSPGLAESLRAEPPFADRLAADWAAPGAQPPGLAAYLTALQGGVDGCEGDRTAVTVWEG
ncbi:protein phosphatase 2C domain-containing protein [Streptomyces smyrnaeus]|uniref:protein phosphatase 2C domain-containing protein n=1 Tax=Streptomyces smyrnaeus TaxID=1387713 RepID=UPI00368ED35A